MTVDHQGGGERVKVAGFACWVLGILLIGAAQLVGSGARVPVRGVGAAVAVVGIVLVVANMRRRRGDTG